MSLLEHVAFISFGKPPSWISYIRRKVLVCYVNGCMAEQLNLLYTGTIIGTEKSELRIKVKTVECGTIQVSSIQKEFISDLRKLDGRLIVVK